MHWVVGTLEKNYVGIHNAYHDTPPSVPHTHPVAYGVPFHAPLWCICVWAEIEVPSGA